ncbi:hypothetical protein M9H77_18957 [Catharanthus roseus]|uniref:Uncharacterized protein n=1 Tax=Catharanthus roseus TaxID=4058 RepID=A0ACC0B8Z3_CATRO|nr:hypothetical protein M9H77_18957 [Catharanthus roseus]
MGDRKGKDRGWIRGKGKGKDSETNGARNAPWTGIVTKLTQRMNTYDFRSSIRNERRSGGTCRTTYWITPVWHEVPDAESAPMPLAMPCLVPGSGVPVKGTSAYPRRGGWHYWQRPSGENAASAKHGRPAPGEHRGGKGAWTVEETGEANGAKLLEKGLWSGLKGNLVERPAGTHPTRGTKKLIEYKTYLQTYLILIIQRAIAGRTLLKATTSLITLRLPFYQSY